MNKIPTVKQYRLQITALNVNRYRLQGVKDGTSKEGLTDKENVSHPPNLNYT